ncbi:MAG: 5-oxoprolinase, partial [Candidatus Solibacter sp.]|nr:5-oxoprolinase [Candidatus Solibacter sp.]
MRIGIDSGGTFTDFVVLDGEGRLSSFKLRSNPSAPHEVILEGIRRAAGRVRAEVVHGSTVATNALLERKGAECAFVTTAGFEDLLEIGRQNRPKLFDLAPGPRRLLIARERCFGVDERTHADGSIARRPSKAELKRVKAAVKRAGVRSVAVCLLHAWRTPENERAVLEALGGEFDVSVSHEICPEFREYERASTTALNAYVGPLMRDYLSKLALEKRHRISVVQSNGGSMTLEEASRQAVRTILSGPAGGVSGAMEVARASGFGKVLGFDMGGTSTDVHLSDGAPAETMEAAVDGFPVRVPMLEIHTVGAGGGSIARVDAGGLLRVGPESAG